MTEAASIARVSKPATVLSLTVDLRALGVRPGSTLLVHASLSALGYVVSGPVSVILALEAALGEAGTLVMPAHSGDCSDPAEWRHPPVPAGWVETVRTHMPAFDPELTPTRGMGVIAESFRKQPGTRRSAHPSVSFAARGPQAEFVTRAHTLAFGLGEGSPLARLYDLDAWVLLLGVGHDRNTSLHLAEQRADFPGKRRARAGAPLTVDGARQWVWYDDLDWDDGDFPQIGAEFARATGLERSGPVGAATARLMPQRALVDFGVRWLTANRAAREC